MRGKLERANQKIQRMAGDAPFFFLVAPRPATADLHVEPVEKVILRYLLKAGP